MNQEELVKRYDELVEYMGEIPFEDASARREVVKDIAIMGRLLLDSEKQNFKKEYAKTQAELNKAKIEADALKVNAENANGRRELIGTIIKTLGSLAGSFMLGFLSFKGEWLECVLKDRTLWDLAKSLKPKN